MKKLMNSSKIRNKITWLFGFKKVDFFIIVILIINKNGINQG